MQGYFHLGRELLGFEERSGLIARMLAVLVAARARRGGSNRGLNVLFGAHAPCRQPGHFRRGCISGAVAQHSRGKMFPLYAHPLREALRPAGGRLPPDSYTFDPHSPRDSYETT